MRSIRDRKMAEGTFSDYSKIIFNGFMSLSVLVLLVIKKLIHTTLL